MASNYEDVLNQLRAAGLDVDSIEVGRMRRCRAEGEGREKRGWYIVHELRLDSGVDVLVGSYGVWRGAENNAQKIELGKDYKVNTEQAEAMRKRLAEDKKRAERERQEEARRAAHRATQVWRAASEQGDCDYLAKKGVGAHGVRFTAQGAMLIPMLDTAGQVHGRIARQYWRAWIETFCATTRPKR